MSVRIHWSPIPASSKYFQEGTSTSLDVLMKLFGNGIIGNGIVSDDVKILRAMAVAAQNSFYNEVADVVESVGAIKFWGEY